MAHVACKRAGAVLTAALFYGQLLATVTPRAAWARVEPLTRITRQIQKPNMLIVLDTSGSLTGVPGGSFDYTDEVGVDCDNGVNCRGGLSQGLCAVTGKGCTRDAQCVTRSCAKGFAECATDSDCQPIAGKCGTGQACYLDADCPALTTGVCQSSGSTCSASHRCTASLKCKYGNLTCSSNADCRPGVCADSASTCTTSSDCPYATAGGTCAFGATPGAGCARVSDCPARDKICSDNPAHTCATVNDCGGTCHRAGTACHANAECRGRSNDYCDFGGKTCSAPSNSCILPRLTCAIRYTDNLCGDTNPCVPNVNPCSGVSTNRCLPGSPADVCNAGGGSTGSRMCRLGQDRCTRDSDCSMSGDSCGPATSRLVIAKRVIRNIVSANASVVNLGLMTFYQAGYFPYFVVSGGSPSTASTMIKDGTLRSAGCYSKKTGLTAICTVNGKTYTLRGSDNARYLIKGHGHSNDKYEDANYCGWFCDIPGAGTGVFKGAYYDYTDVQGTLGAQVNFPTYRGKVFTDGGVTYRYYDARPDYYNGGPPPPINTVNCSNSCSATCGGRWDTQLAPFLSTDTSTATTDAVIAAFNQAMEPASEGGLISFNGTPSGCTLENNVAADRNHSAYHYMQAVKQADPLSCRLNYVLFVTDGEANGPGDSNCASAACSASDPQAAGCSCRAVLAAFHMRQNLGVKTFVVGFSTDAATGAGHLVNDNIARAGGTDVGGDGQAPFSFGAANEEQLSDAIQGAIYQAIQGSYSTSPATASQGTVHGATEQSGSYLLDARVDFPSWKGHLVAYDLSSGSPVVAWDAATRLANTSWRSRRVYTSDAAGHLVLIDVDPSSGAIRNKAALNALGLGSSPDEAELIARWLLGDPALKNPAILGSIINSTPIDVGPAADGTAPGAHQFYLANLNRPSVTYVGADDGMLHAFYTRDVTALGVSHQGGDEAFAFLPRSMLRTATKLYAQGGQLADPGQHVFGLASSPKVKSLCIRSCDDSNNAVWKTTLVMTEGWGGNGVFMLDISNPVPASGTPFQLLWSSAEHNQAATYGNALGVTVSVPAFTFIPGGEMNDHRVTMVSGYPVDDASTTQGRSVISASVQDGRIMAEQRVVPAGSACAQEYTLLTDVATSRLHMKNESGIATGRKQLLAGYFGDTWGNLWRYTPSDGNTHLVSALGCDHPLHFSPTVVQMDADDPDNANAGQIYLVQATNSTLDRETESYPPSRMVIFKETVTGGGSPTIDTTFGTNGQIVLSASNTRQLCAVTTVSGDSCLTALPAGARPLATPTGIVKPDGTGFVLLSNWYAPAANGCGKGVTYLQVHDVSGSTVTLKQALKIADEPVVNPIIVNGILMVSSSAGPLSVNGSMTLKVESATQPLRNVGDPFQLSNWTEID